MKLGQGMVSTISRAMLARILFAAHSIIAISQMVEVYGETAYWGFTLLTCSIFIEGFVTILQREGQEAKWFCPSVFLYLCSVVPPIWYLQLDLSHKRFQAFENNTTYEELERQQGMQVVTQLEMRFKLSHELWIQMLEQTLLVVLIVGRWLLPKGDITREQLSQILLAYLAIASDIVELFDMFKENVINRMPYLPRVILAVWTLSVLQFPLVFTTSKARKMRVALTTSNSDEEIKRLQYMADCEAKSRPKWMQAMGDVDIWAIVVACLLQDLPFLAVRAHLMLSHHLMGYTMIFFTCKNVLVILLQLYRLFVIVHERYRGAQIEEDARRLTQHYRQMLHACKEVLTKLKDEGSTHVHNITHNRNRPKKTGGGAKSKTRASASGSGSSGGGSTSKRGQLRSFEDILETDESAISPKSDKRNDVLVVVKDESTIKSTKGDGESKRRTGGVVGVKSPEITKTSDNSDSASAIVHRQKSTSPPTASPPPVPPPTMTRSAIAVIQEINKSPRQQSTPEFARRMTAPEIGPESVPLLDEAGVATAGAADDRQIFSPTVEMAKDLGKKK